MKSSSSSSVLPPLTFIIVTLLLVVFIFVCLFDYSSNRSSSRHNINILQRTPSNFFPQSLLLRRYNNKTSPVMQTKELTSKLVLLEAGLSRARASIKNFNRHSSTNRFLSKKNSLYRNSELFHRSYLEMEKTFKVYVYEEGDLPMFHTGPCKDLYTTEGLFINQLEVEKKIRTFDPAKAHVYFLPFSIVQMVHYLYIQNSWNISDIKTTVADYIGVLADKYPYWNRSLGADHVMLSCHDWGPLTSFHVPNLYNNSIRVLCNANTSEGFNPRRDVSLPEINLKTGEFTGLIGGGLPPSKRTLLAFFAGGLHGNIRTVLLDQWKDKDKDVLVYESIPKGTSYYGMMRKSKYCLCPSGYEVASPRIVEAIYAECVPVLISDSYVPPFSDILNWNSFSVQIPLRDIPNIKKILMEIPQERYFRLQRKVKQLQRHFTVNFPPRRYDALYMTLHSIWLRRLNIRIRDQILS